MKEALHTMDLLSGKGAPKDLLTELRTIAETHHPDAQIDCCRAYHFGERFLIEVECIVDEDTSVRDAHAIALSLQRKVFHNPKP